jgi:hypothetical protein
MGDGLDMVKVWLEGVSSGLSGVGRGGEGRALLAKDRLAM